MAACACVLARACVGARVRVSSVRVCVQVLYEFASFVHHVTVVQPEAAPAGLTETPCSVCVRLRHRRRCSALSKMRPLVPLISPLPPSNLLSLASLRSRAAQLALVVVPPIHWATARCLQVRAFAC